MPAVSKDFNEVVRYLQTQFVCVISTVTQDAKPQAATVFYWANDINKKKGTFSLYFVTRRHTRKFENLMFNKAVAVVVGTEFQPTTVQIDGDAELVESATGIADLTQFMKRMVTHPTAALMYAGAFFPRNPFTRLEGDNYAVFKITPRWVRWMHREPDKKEITYRQIIG